MMITVNEVEYDTEDMTKQQRGVVANIQGLERAIQHWTNEIVVRELSRNSLVGNKNAMVNDLVVSLTPKEKVTAPKGTKK